MACTPDHRRAAAPLPIRADRSPDLAWIEAAADAAHPFSAGLRSPRVAADSSSAGSRRLRETADFSSVAVRPSSAGSRPLLEAANSSAATRPSSAPGLRPVRQTAHSTPSRNEAPFTFGPPTGVPLPDSRTLLHKLETDLSQMRVKLSQIEDTADRKLATAVALHGIWKDREFEMEQKMHISDAKIAQLEDVIKLMQAEGLEKQDRAKSKRAAMNKEKDLMTELNDVFQTLEGFLSTIEHAWQCNVQPCSQQYCGDFQNLLLHVSKCPPQTEERDCGICKFILPLLSLHARYCTSDACTFLLCQIQREVLK